jgi:nitric oxide dioxygenase
VHALRDEVALLAGARPHPGPLRLQRPRTPEDLERGHCDRTGLIDLDWLQELLPAMTAISTSADPGPSCASLYRDLRRWDVPEDRIHFEFFGPREEIEDAAAVEVG